MNTRVVDLGREDELVTWHEWMHRCETVMQGAVTDEQRPNLAFRVTLMDGRAFAVAHSMTHVARGKCELAPNRWIDTDGDGKPDQSEAICDVITGYMFIGVGEDSHPTTLSIPPTEIASVECVYVAPEEESEPFGFARALKQKDRPTMGEVEEPATTPA